MRSQSLGWVVLRRWCCALSDLLKFCCQIQSFLSVVLFIGEGRIGVGIAARWWEWGGRRGRGVSFVGGLVVRVFQGLVRGEWRFAVGVVV